MKTSIPAAELCGSVVINGTYVKVLKCGNQLIFTHATNSDASAIGTTSNNVITITNGDNTTSTITLPTTFSGTNIFREFTIPLLYKSIVLTTQASPAA